MSEKIPTPTPSGDEPDTEIEFEEPGQDESGKSAAPQSPQGPRRKPKAVKPAPGGAKKNEDPRPM